MEVCMHNGWILRGARLLEAAQGKFVASENLGKLVMTGLLSMVPTFEGRYAVTVMLGLGMPAGFAYLFALVCSSIPIPCGRPGSRDASSSSAPSPPWQTPTRPAST